jgi:N utilization substance protein A
VNFIEDSLSPAEVISVKIASEPNEETGERGHAIAEVAPDQQSLAIGRGGQNVRLAAKLTGWKIDIVSAQTGDALAEADATGKVEIEAGEDTIVGSDVAVLEGEDGMTTNPELPNEDEPTSDRDVNPDSEEMDEIDTPEEAEALVAEETEAAEAEVEKETKE